MLPYVLIQTLIFIVSLLLPSYLALHSITHGQIDSTRRWLFYLCCLVLISGVVLPILEPALIKIFSYFPLSFYYELKFTAFVILVMPRFGVLDRCMERSELHFESLQKLVVEKGNEVFAIARAQATRFREMVESGMKPKTN